MTLSATIEGRDQLTEAEVLAAARSIRELKALRDIDHSRDAKITVGAGMTSFSIPLEPEEAEACVALLIERHTVLLTSLGIVPDRPSR